MATLRGLNAAVQNRTRIRYTDAGNEVELSYAGPADQVAALVSDLRAQGYEVEIVADSSPLARLTATLPQGEAAGRTGEITDTDNVTGVFTAPAHELSTGDIVLVSGIVGVSTTTEYFVAYDSDDTFYLYDTEAHARAGGDAGKIIPTENDDTGSFARQESPQPRWELFNQNRPVSILKAKIPSLAVQLSDAQKKVLKKGIDQGVDVLTEEETELFTSAPADATAQTNVYMAALYDGVTEIEVSTFTLSVARTVSGVKKIFDAATGANQLISTTALILAEGIPAEIYANMPAYTDPPTRKVYGWRKNFPKIEFIGGGRVVINQTWEYDLWSEPSFPPRTVESDPAEA